VADEKPIEAVTTIIEGSKVKRQRTPVSKDSKSNADAPAPAAKRVRVVRNFPASPFEDALSFAKAVLDYGSGAPVRRVTLFNHLGKSPESGLSRQMITNANKYNLIKGGYQANVLELSPEGKRLPTTKYKAGNERARECSLQFSTLSLSQACTNDSNLSVCQRKVR
jgi:hypothetical protein